MIFTIKYYINQGREFISLGKSMGPVFRAQQRGFVRFSSIFRIAKIAPFSDTLCWVLRMISKRSFEVGAEVSHQSITDHALCKPPRSVNLCEVIEVVARENRLKRKAVRLLEDCDVAFACRCTRFFVNVSILDMTCFVRGCRRHKSVFSPIASEICCLPAMGSVVHDPFTVFKQASEAF